jgi:hypothetical protein
MPRAWRTLVRTDRGPAGSARCSPRAPASEKCR